MSVPTGSEVEAQAQSSGATPSPTPAPCPSGDVPKEGSRDIQGKGKIISVPHDWCKSTDSPVPYKIWPWQSSASNLANSVRQTDCRSHVLGSIVNQCYGDEPGTGGGVKSGTNLAECTPLSASPTVRAEGKPMVRYLDKWWMNHKNTWGCLNNSEDMGRYDPPKLQKIDAKLSPIPSREEDQALKASGTQVAGGGGAAPAVENDPETFETPAERSEEWHREVAEPGDPEYTPPRSHANDNIDETEPKDDKEMEAPEAKEKPDSAVRVSSNKGTVRCWNSEKFLSKRPATQHTELITEYCKQLREQEKALNDMSPEQYQEGRQYFNDNGRINDQDAFKQTSIDNLRNDLMEQGMSYNDASDSATSMLGGLVGLHAPDQVAAGNYSQLLSMGLPSVNSSIGGGWRWRVGDLDYAEAAKKSGQKKMNVRLCAEVDGQPVC